MDLGVLKEDTENTFRLLEYAEEKSTTEREPRTGVWYSLPTLKSELTHIVVVAVDEPAPVSSVQQQQAEQMRVYWKVRLLWRLHCGYVV